MGRSLSEINLTRREVLSLSALAALKLGEMYLLGHAPGFFDRLSRTGATGEYPSQTVELFDGFTRNVVEYFQSAAQTAGIVPSRDDSIRNPQTENRKDVLIPSLPPNTYMVFIPGGFSEELGDWVRQFYEPWITAFNCTRTGKGKNQVAVETAGYIDSLDIDRLMGADPQVRRNTHLKIMLMTNTPIFPWEYVTGGRVNNGQVPPEHPEAMSIFLAGYVRWILKSNPEARFILWGHSLGASAVHCLLRLIQGGVYKDIAGHVSHAILYSEALNDKSNEILYRLVERLGSRDLTVESVSKTSLGQGKSLENILPIALNAAVVPDYYNGLNPQYLKDKHKIRTVCIYSPDDPVSGGVPGAEGVVLDFPKSGCNGDKPRIIRGIVPDPSEFISLPADLGSVMKMFGNTHHNPNKFAVEPVFGY